ncbi:MAG: NOL1/NOP2/sun family putative RNA methylase [Prolixibacteraceae bacterium]|jgi:tRNA (cytosine49-C5)-methyltransferase|nr:NOL1/NOP2/sun family putative RNA methylase [Prolixibacteraceae bacterium]
MAKKANEPEQIPGTEEIIFKKGFIERYSSLTNWCEFKRYSLSFLRRSIRVNTLKATVEEVKKSIEAKGWKLDPVPWCKEGFWISHPDRRDVGNLIEHKLGKIYVQEAASMIPPVVLQPKPGELVLDMCAAPGSKTTQMAAMMNSEGMLIANDYRGLRVQSLGINLQRSGITNVLVTLMDGSWFKEFQFDRILVDAPCSGTGTIRKSLKTINMWNPGMVTKICNQQKVLAKNAFLNLKPGGVMVYSTCSLEPEENEGVVDYLIETFPNEINVEQIDLPGLKKANTVLEFKGKKYHPDVTKTLRVWPQDADTEGFFVAKIIKLKL